MKMSAAVPLSAVAWKTLSTGSSLSKVFIAIGWLPPMVAQITLRVAGLVLPRGCTWTMPL